MSLTNINFISMMANKLEELKRKMLLASQLKKENPETIPEPRLLEGPHVQAEPSIQIAVDNKPKQPEQEQDLIDSPDESNSAENVQEQAVPIEQPPKQQGKIDLSPHDEKQQGMFEEDGEIKQDVEEPIVEKQVQNHKQAQQPLVQNQQNLDLGREQNQFMSVDDQVRQIMTQKINEIQRQMEPEISKVEKKVNKVVIKELLKVKQCIKNLQSAVIGLEYIQERVKYYPSLKDKLRKQIKHLKSLSQQ